MNRSIEIEVNERMSVYIVSQASPHVIREVDYVRLRIQALPGDPTPIIYLGDYVLECIPSSDGAFFETRKHCFFAESFGIAIVMLELPEGLVQIAFDVLAKKTTAEQAYRMIRYIASVDESLIQSFLARTSYQVGTERASYTDPEMVLTTASKFIEQLQEYQPELVCHLRQRLVPTRVPLWETDRMQSEIDPYDVIHNLDALAPSTSEGDLLLRGRHYDLTNIHVSKIASTADVLENRVLLGGLYSIRAKILDLRGKLNAYNLDETNLAEEFESLSRLMLRITAGSMLNRCHSLLANTEGFIKFFHQKLEVTHHGEIAPTMTPFVRSTRVYRLLFTHLSLWYELGKPTIEGVNFLMKLKSLSSLYEIFVLFHLIEELLRQGWIVDTMDPKEGMERFVPSKSVMHRGNETLTLEYEPAILPFSNDTRHMALVDIKHRGSGEFSRWMPDYVLRLDSQGATRYLILDAKYSSRSSVRDFKLPDLYEKYFAGLAVFNAEAMIISSAPILGVFAVYALDYRTCTYLSHWQGMGLNSHIMQLPLIGGIGLMTDNATLFNSAIPQLLDIATRLMSRPQSVSYSLN